MADSIMGGTNSMPSQAQAKDSPPTQAPQASHLAPHPNKSASPPTTSTLPDHENYRLDTHPSTSILAHHSSPRLDNRSTAASSPSITSTMAGIPSREDQPPGDQLQAIPKGKLIESGADYESVFRELQIRPERYDEVVTGILQPVRAKRIKMLKTATAAMIKDLSTLFLRGYGSILYHKQPDKWLLTDAELQAQGKTRIIFTVGDMSVDGKNAEFFRILEPMWWIMRGVVFEEKPMGRKRGRGFKEEEEEGGSVQLEGMDVDGEPDELPHKEQGVIARPRGRPPKTPAQTQAMKAAQSPKMNFERNQQTVLQRIEVEIDARKTDRSWRKVTGRMTALETDEAVQELIVRLQEIRGRSESGAFERAWEVMLGRLEEVDGEEVMGLDVAPSEMEVEPPLKKVKLTETTPPPQAISLGLAAQQQVAPSGLALPQQVVSSGPAPPQQGTSSGPIPSRPAILPGVAGTISSIAPNRQDLPRTLPPGNFANEPFNTVGPPSILNRLTLGQTPLIPSSISVYISTSPPLSPYSKSAYHWPSAPIGLADCKRLFDGIDQRVDVRQISGYTFSYGWNDVMRAVGATDQEKRHGFDVLLQDVKDGAMMGTTRWRLKVLVIGVAPVYQSRV